MKKLKQLMSTVLLSVMVIGMTFTTGCSKKTDPAKTLVVSIGDNDIYLNEVMFYVYNIEQIINQQGYDTNYWDTEYEGKTMRDVAKQYIMDTITLTEILYDKAQADGLTLTEEEKTNNQTQAEQILATLTEEQLKVTGLNKDLIVKILDKGTLGDKYYAKAIENFDVDKDAITSVIKKEDYKQYNTEFLFVPTTKFDENQQVVDFTEEEKLTSKKLVDSLLEKVKAGEDFSKIAEEDDSIFTSTSNFVVGDNTTEQEYQNAAIALKKGDYTPEPVLTKYGYYIIKLLDDQATDSYDQAVNAAIQDAKSKAFETEYETMKKDYKIDTKDKVWDSIVIGEMTSVKTVTEDTTNENTTDTNTTDTDTTDTNTTDTNTTDAK